MRLVDAAATTATIAALSLLAGCSTTRDTANDSAASQVAVPDSVIVRDSTAPATAADSALVESVRSRLEVAENLLRAPTAGTPIEGTRLFVRRDASQRVNAALVAPEHPDTPADAQYLYVFDEHGMASGVEKTWSDSSRACPRPARVTERWMLHDGRVIGFERTRGESGEPPAGPACAIARDSAVVLYTSWPMLSNSSLVTAPPAQ
jgi:hypothetical protein